MRATAIQALGTESCCWPIGPIPVCRHGKYRPFCGISRKMPTWQTGWYLPSTTPRIPAPRPLAGQRLAGGRLAVGGGARPLPSRRLLWCVVRTRSSSINNPTTIPSRGGESRPPFLHEADHCRHGGRWRPGSGTPSCRTVARPLRCPGPGPRTGPSIPGHGGPGPGGGRRAPADGG